VANEASVNEDYFHGAYCQHYSFQQAGLHVVQLLMKFLVIQNRGRQFGIPVEEQNWVAAAEFADSAGTDMISTSLGYNIFDDPVYNHIS
jgi:hypothetical protein